MIFDPDGRGLSVGVEDYDGFIHQDGLAEIIRFSASLPEVDPERIGVISFSYGVTMAAGALARYPDLPVRFLIDMEGPADRNDTGGCSPYSPWGSAYSALFLSSACWSRWASPSRSTPCSRRSP